MTQIWERRTDEQTVTNAYCIHLVNGLLADRSNGRDYGSVASVVVVVVCRLRRYVLCLIGAS